MTERVREVWLRSGCYRVQPSEAEWEPKSDGRSIGLGVAKILLRAATGSACPQEARIG